MDYLLNESDLEEIETEIENLHWRILELFERKRILSDDESTEDDEENECPTQGETRVE